ncbi:alpha/beta hydrolase [Nocardioides yefusunii]|uniref:Alpha/beta hydrolase n=1 Tax=Nocardioides yefusunii TaxID=2500546 RepID=A0ABW1QS97_9ACTN|nr:alpha/beta hydrolase [Nocardioides yefusunii]
MSSAATSPLAGVEIERHYATLPAGSASSGAQVHYLRAGHGKPVVLTHSSPMSAETMKHWIEPLAARFTVYALDTAGYGQSDPLTAVDGDEPTIDDYAVRVLEFADAVGLDRFTIGGTHTGSKIALAVAVRAPGRVAQLVMDGLGIYTSAEMLDQLDRYTPPVVPDWYGGHLLEAWHRMRNMWTFFPWYDQRPEARLDESLPALEDLHQMTFDLLRSPDWGLAYRAAFRYDARAALERLKVPAVLVAKEADPLHGHLPRLGVDAPSLTVTSVANADHMAAVVAAFDDAVDLPDAPQVPATVHLGGTTRRYVRTASGTTHVRFDGDPDAPVVLLVHGSPGSADSFDDLIRDLAADHLVVSPDTLGNGFSSPPHVDLEHGVVPEIGDFADVTAEVMEALGLRGVKAYGSHTGACIALELACRRPDLVAQVVADGLPVLDEESRRDILANYFIDMSPTIHGEHLVRAWHTIRDVQLYWPWYRTDAVNARPTAPSDPEHLHRLVMEFVKSGSSYKYSYGAAFRFMSQERLAAVDVPVLVCATPEDMLREGSEDIAGGRISFVELEPAAGRGAAWALRQVN